MNLFEVNSVGALVRFEILMGFETCFFMLTNFFGRKYNYFNQFIIFIIKFIQFSARS